MSFDGETTAAGDDAPPNVGGATDPPMRRPWDEVMADFDRDAFKPGDLVSDDWIAHSMLVARVEDLPADATPSEVLYARDRWWHSCSALVDQVRSRRRLHLVRAKGANGYFVLDHRDVSDHEMRLLVDRLTRQIERAGDHLGDVQVDKLTLDEQRRLRDAQTHVATLARLTAPKLRKFIGSGKPDR